MDLLNAEYLMNIAQFIEKESGLVIKIGSEVAYLGY